MKFRLSVIQYLFCICFLSINCTITSNHDLPNSAHSRQQNSSQHGVQKPKTKFADLNEDVLSIINDNLPLKDWPSLAKTNSKLSLVVCDSFRRKYRDFEVKILETHSKEGKTIVESSNNKQIQIHDFAAAVAMMMNFGHLMKRLNINSDQMAKTEATAINQLIQTYCTTLTHLSLGFINADTLQQFKTPFQNVQELSFIVKKSGVNGGVLPLNELFPALKSLAFHAEVDMTFIDCEFPMLEHLCAGINDDSSIASKKTMLKDRIESLITKNVQIRSIDIDGFPKDYVKVINKLLPNIENLTVSSFDIGHSTLRMENVKNFMLYETSPVSIDKLFLPQLESLKMYYTPIFSNSWMKFFKNHPDLRRLDLTESFTMEIVPLVEFTAAFRDLHEMVLRCTTYIDVETIGQFIESHDKMMKFQFSIRKFKTEDSQVLKRRFENEWLIRDFGDKSWTGHTFERRQ